MGKNLKKFNEYFVDERRAIYNTFLGYTNINNDYYIGLKFGQLQFSFHV